MKLSDVQKNTINRSDDDKSDDDKSDDDKSDDDKSDDDKSDDDNIQEPIPSFIPQPKVKQPKHTEDPVKQDTKTAEYSCSAVHASGKRCRRKSGHAGEHLWWFNGIPKRPTIAWETP